MPTSYERTTPVAIDKLEREITRLEELKKKSDSKALEVKAMSEKYTQQIIIKKKLLENHKKILEHMEEIRKLRGGIT